MSQVLKETLKNQVPIESTKSQQFIRPHIRNLKPYTPIVPFEVLSQKYGKNPRDIVKLDANENPYGPPPQVLEKLGSLEYAYIYPDPETRKLRSLIAQQENLDTRNILVGCGADELIDLVMRCCLDPGDAILDLPPTFTMYNFDANVNNAQVISIDRNSDFSIDVSQVIHAVQNNENIKIVFLTSPNNPDGSMISDQQLKDVLSLNVLVVLDEAYIDFSTVQTKMKWVENYNNLVVLRTFSKSAGLAGLRIGYGAFPLDLIEYLWRIKQPYNVSVAAEEAACVALQNQNYMQVTNKFDAKDLKENLASRFGIMVRHYANKYLQNYIRISVGKQEHTDLIIKALQHYQQQDSI